MRVLSIVASAAALIALPAAATQHDGHAGHAAAPKAGDAIAAAVARAHGGRLDVLARPEGGLTVRALIPAPPAR